MRKVLLLILIVIVLLFPTSTSAQIYTNAKLITIDLGKQMLYAWDAGRIVFQTPISTGMYYTPTIKGSFKIYRKINIQDMKGSYPPYEPYFIKNVPNIMYFYGAYAIHGTYWHNSFGARASHGCVNLPVAASQWLYTFADTGTRVEVF